MFIFFLSGSFFSFWQNEPGQTFFDLTVKGMKWNPSLVSLRHYPTLSSVPELFRFEENGDLVIQKKVINEETQEESIVDDYTVTAELYVENGVKLIAC